MIAQKSPVEIITVTFDFTGLVATMSNATITVDVERGAPDATPQALLLGQPLIDGSIVKQRVTGGQDGTLYALRCLAQDEDGERPEIVVGLLVRTRTP